MLTSRAFIWRMRSCRSSHRASASKMSRSLCSTTPSRRILNSRSTTKSACADLEIGVDSRRVSWTLSDAHCYQNIDEDAPDYLIKSGDLQIKFVRGIPKIRTKIGQCW